MIINDPSSLDEISRSVQFSILVLPKKYGLSSLVKYLKIRNKFIIEPEDGLVSTEQIRDIKDICKSKQQGLTLFVINHAELMSTTAQNAFLKLLEEPGQKIYLMLVTDDTSRFLPTTKSRAQIFEVSPISEDESRKLALLHDSNIDKTKLTQILFLASGLPDEIVKLVTDESYFEQNKVFIDYAKTMINGTAYQKLVLCNQLKSKRDDALKVIDLAILMLKNNYKNTPNRATLNKLDDLNELSTALSTNANVRLSILANVL